MDGGGAWIGEGPDSLRLPSTGVDISDNTPSGLRTRPSPRTAAPDTADLAGDVVFSLDFTNQ